MAFVCDKRHYEPLINLQQSHRFVWFTMQILISRERACRSELQSWHVKRSIARLLSGSGALFADSFAIFIAINFDHP